MHGDGGNREGIPMPSVVGSGVVCVGRALCGRQPRRKMHLYVGVTYNDGARVQFVMMDSLDHENGL